MSSQTRPHQIMRLQRAHLAQAATVLARAFVQDPLTEYVFAVSKASRDESLRELGRFSCEVRLLLGWPLLGSIEARGRVAGVLGVSLPGDPQWPPALNRVYARLGEVVGPESIARLEAYSRLADTNRPKQPHYQVGILGVDPTLQGQGHGGALMRALHAIADADAEAVGTWLDTENPRNVAWYRRFGYEVQAESLLDGLAVWGMFREGPGPRA
ncbi:MAG: GNAT family N-acetyltransferase [Anaerolineae bacterium]|nr:GNAT family N-acetyltransferase [Anaerolineae bacterium]